MINTFFFAFYLHYYYIPIDIDSGVYDLFYEPMDAITESPDQFTRGIAKGSLSLMKHTIHGVSNSASKVTESLGNATSMLSMDGDYIRSRSQSLAYKRPKHVGEGLVSGIQALGSGILEGATGIIVSRLHHASHKLTLTLLRRNQSKEHWMRVLEGYSKGLVEGSLVFQQNL